MRKFIVKFGFFLDENEIEISDQAETINEKENGERDILKPWKELEINLEKEKEDILSILKKEPLVSKIYPLENDTNIKKLFSHSLFGEPIKFKIKLPSKNQEISEKYYHYDKIYEAVEDFNVIFDGNLFAVYQEIHPTKIDFLGAPDLREKLYDMFREIYPKLTIIPPTPFRENFVYLVSYSDNELQDEIEKNELDFIFPLDEVDFEKKIYSLFKYNEIYLRNIYYTHRLSTKINRISSDIVYSQKKLNQFYADVINTKYIDFFNYDKKRSVKLQAQNLCELLLDYVLAVNEFEVDLSNTIHHLNKEAYFEKYMEELKNEVNEYTKIDVDVMFKYIENIRNELDTRSINISTIASGIIGGVIGAVGMIIITLIT